MAEVAATSHFWGDFTNLDLDRFFAPYNPPRTSLIDCLAYWTDIQPADVAYRSTDGEEEETVLTYAQFAAKVAAVAARLTALKMRGERALLLYPQGLDFLIGYYGCLAAGAVAVPAYPPRRNRNMDRIQAISDDAQAKVALTVHDVSNGSPIARRSAAAQKSDLARDRSD